MNSDNPPRSTRVINVKNLKLCINVLTKATKSSSENIGFSGSKGTSSSSASGDSEI